MGHPVVASLNAHDEWSCASKQGILHRFRQKILASNRYRQMRLRRRLRGNPNRLDFFMVDSVGKRRRLLKVVIK